MLSFEEFMVLDEDLQTQVLSMDGVFLDLIRGTRNVNIELYALFSFYVEIFFDKITEEPLYLKPFRNIDLLDPYLEMVEISAAFVTK